MRDVPKPFLEHLEDLRSTIIKMGVTIVLATVLCFIFRREVVEILYKPLIWAGESPDKFLKVLGVVDPFMLALQVAFFAGFLFALPLLLFFLGEFVLPALTDRETRMVAPVFFGGTGLFVIGVAFCYFVLLPQALKFFLNFSIEMGFQSEWTVQNYIGFVVQMLAALGICFELPMVILILAVLGIVDAQMLNTHRRHAIVVIVVLAAVITPTQDMFTLALMAGPMWLLYEGCVVICWWMERRDRAAEERERKKAQKLAVVPPSGVPQAAAPAAAEGTGAVAGETSGDPYEQLEYGGGDTTPADSGTGDAAAAVSSEGGPADEGGGAGAEPDAGEAQIPATAAKKPARKTGKAPASRPAKKRPVRKKTAARKTAKRGIKPRRR